MIPHVRNALEHGLKGGLHVRFLLLKPNSEAVRMAAFRDSFEDEKRINLALQATISDLSILPGQSYFSSQTRNSSRQLLAAVDNNGI